MDTLGEKNMPTIMKRPAKRTISKTQYQKGKELMDNKKIQEIPRSKKPLVNKTLVEMERRYVEILRKVETINTKLKKMTNSQKAKIDKEAIADLSKELDVAKMLVRKKQIKFVGEYIPEIIEIYGSKPEELLLAGFSVKDVAFGIYTRKEKK